MEVLTYGSINRPCTLTQSMYLSPRLSRSITGLLEVALPVLSSGITDLLLLMRSLLGYCPLGQPVAPNGRVSGQDA